MDAALPISLLKFSESRAEKGSDTWGMITPVVAATAAEGSGALATISGLLYMHFGF